MAEDRFKYREMASKVLKQERSTVTRNEPSGESDRILSSTLVGTMGSAVRDRPKPQVKTKRKKDEEAISTAAKRAAREAYEELMRSGGTYVPTTKLTEKSWEAFLTQLTHYLPTVSRDVLTSAAEEALNALKDSEKTARDKRRDVENIVGKITDEDYRSMVERAEQLTDFVVQVADAEKKTSRRSKESEIAIVFEGDEDDEEQGLADLPGAEGLDEEDAVEAEVVSSEEEDNVDTDKDQPNMLRRARVDESQLEEAKPDLTLDPHSIDAYWLQREVGLTTSDPEEARRLGELVLTILAETDASTRENLLLSNLGFERSDLVKKLMRHRAVIYYCTQLARAKDEAERERIRGEMMEDSTSGGQEILRSLAGMTSSSVPSSKKAKHVKEGETVSTIVPGDTRKIMPSSRVIDLQTLARMDPRPRVTQVTLPKGSWSKTTKQFEEVHVQPLKSRPLGPDEHIVAIPSLPKWMQPAFAGMTELNRVQSRVYPAIMHSDRFNMLVSAPTGSGKTNIAMLAVMQEVSQFVDVSTGKVDVESLKEKLKIVYVAPMKALVQEVVMNFSSRLSGPFGITVKELSGDQQLSRAELASTQMIVTTPEKWDVVTRKAGERSFVSTVRLIIIDEIHLLHDTRGAVLEAVVARTLRSNEESKAPCRLLGISATLPNYRDVAVFLRVPTDRGLFYFDNSYRPVPLQQVFIGVTDQKAVRRMKTMDEVCFDKVKLAAESHQVLVFVHSRKDTVRTAKMIRDNAVESNSQQNFLPPEIGSREILTQCATRALTGNEQVDASVARSADLRDLLPYGFAVHHAGMHKSDRRLVEDLFAQGHVRVLVSTATLAWGVNLPAHTVVIKGTQVYNPEQGGWTELSHLDLLQMLGRAGRPQFDQEQGAEGIVITSLVQMQHYLSLLNDQLPVESSLLKRLADHLNAEIVCGNIANISDAVHWLGYTFLLVRALTHPDRYGVIVDDDDADLVQWRADLAHAAFQALDKHQLVRYDRKTGMVQSTSLGRIASHYYLSPETCSAYMRSLDPLSGDLDLVRVLTVADEFKQVQVRAEEKAELARLVERVPIPIKETLDDPSAKINVLLQAYVSRLPLEGFCLACDMVYVHQSAARLARAMFEMSLSKNWAGLARRSLHLCVSIDKRVWFSQSPLRQFPPASSPLILREEVFKQLEKRALPLEQYRELSAVELGAKISPSTLGVPLFKAFHRFPKLDLASRVQTMTRSVLRIELAVNADFEFDESTHGPAILFWVLVEDVNGEELLHYEQFLLKSRYAKEEHLISFTIQLNEPTPPFVFVRLEADQYLHASSTLAIPLSVLTLPPKAAPFSELLDMSPIQIVSLPAKQKDFMEKVHPEIKQLWPSQTQAFSLVDTDDSSALVCCPVGKGVLADLVIAKTLSKKNKVVFITSWEDVCRVKFEHFQRAFPNATVSYLKGADQSRDLDLVVKSQLIIASSRTWEVLSRRWKQKSRLVITDISLIVLDDLHAMDDSMELVISRTRYMCVQLDKHIRILGLSASIINADDASQWMAAGKHCLALAPSARPYPTELVVRSFSESHFETRIGAMARPCYRAIQPDEKTIVFVPTKRHLRLLLIDLVNFASAEQRSFASVEVEDDLGNELRLGLKSGVAVLHESMSPRDREAAQRVFSSTKCRLLLVSASSVLHMLDSCRAHHVILVNTSWFTNKKYDEYPFPLLLKMLNKATLGPSSRQTLLCHDSVKAFYKRFLVSSIPLESRLDEGAPDIVLSEVVSKTIATKQDAVDFFTWTLFYRRLVKNPSFYGMMMKRNPPVAPEVALSSFLSDTIERVLDDLKETKCVEDNEGDEVKATLLGKVAAFYDVKSSTIDLFASSLQSKTKTAGLLEIVSSASEYVDTAAVRAKEEQVLERLARNAQCVVYKLASSTELDFSESHVKCNVLIQAWCSRFPLGADEREDVVKILKDAPRLLHALVDVSATKAWLRVTLTIIELCQSIVQQVWARESPLRQVPYYDQLLKERFDSQKLKSVYDLIDMEDDKRESLLSVLNQAQLARVAEFCNAYPSLDVALQSFVDGREQPDAKAVRNVSVGSEVTVQVVMNKEAEEEEEDAKMVVSDKFPHEKTVVWWAIIGDPQTNELLDIKRIANDQTKLTMNFDQQGTRHLKLYVACDSYVGCDQFFDLVVDVV